MTFAELKQALFDRIGATAEETMVERLVNEAKDEFSTLAEWSFLEITGSIGFVTNATSAVCPTTIRHILEIDNASGVPLLKVHRDTFRVLYRGSTTTAAAPTRYCIQGAETTGAIKIGLYPIPSAISTGTVRGLAYVPDLVNSTDVPQYIPPAFHHLIVDLAVCRYREWQGDAQTAILAKQSILQQIQSLKGGRPPVEIQNDGR